MRKTLVLLATAAVVSTPAAADMLIFNANGIQVGPGGQLERFDGLLVGDDGKVKAVLAPGAKRPQADRIVDAGSRTLLPGLIDAHGHVMGLGLAALQLDLVGTRSLGELQQRLRDHAASTPGSGWIVGRGWNQELWPDKTMPTAADLDRIVSDRPVWLERVDGHASVGNSAALRAAGITATSAEPAGGRIERSADGNPTGLFIDTAAALVERHVPAPTPEELERAFTRVQEILLANGLTAVADMGTSVDGWNLFRRAGDKGDLKIRIMSYSSGIDPLLTIAGTGPTQWLYGDRLRMVGMKLYGDGALGSRGAWLKAPYSDLGQTSGLAVTDPTDLYSLSRRAAERGLQVAIHAIGDRANAEAIAIFEKLGGPDRRWRIEHAQIIDPADLNRLAPAGIIASMQPIHQVSDRTMAEARLGPDRLDGAYAWQSLARSKARLALGSDFPVEPSNPFLGLSAAVSRQDPGGQPPGGWRPEERLTFAQALSGFTRDAAYAGFAEQKIGSLEPGKWADFILVDRDVSRVAATALARTRVLETWVAGERMYAADGKPGRDR